MGTFAEAQLVTLSSDKRIKRREKIRTFGKLGWRALTSNRFRRKDGIRILAGA